VVHLTTVHAPSDTRIQKQCQTLAEAGYDITLLATGDGRSSPGGVPVRLLRKPGSRRRRMLVTTREAYRVARALDACIYHFHDPELMPVGMALRRHGARVVYDAHEDYSAEIRTKEWIVPPLRVPIARMTECVERVTVSRLDLVVAATSTIARRFPASKTVTVQNFPRVEEFVTPSPSAHGDRKPAVAYVGDVTLIRGIREMVAAMGLIQPDLDVRLLVAGRLSTPGLQEMLSRIPGRERASLLGHQSRVEVRALLGGVRAGLVVFHPTPNHLTSRPNKLYEYMAAGLPVIASNFPEWRKLISELRCGLVVDPEDPAAIAHAIRFLIENPETGEEMGRRGRAAVESVFNWTCEAQRLVSCYDALCGRAPAARAGSGGLK
jgi:glycosyltransferase involved in cell wall biosynthesis